MSLRLSIEIDQGNLLAAVKRVPVALKKHSERAISRIVQNIARSARRRAPKATSQLTQSIRGKRINALSGIIGAHTRYAKAVERGSLPGGFPPLDDLVQWIRVKNIQPRDSEMSDRDLAYVIARSIARKGTKPQPYMEPALEAHRQKAAQRMNAAINAALQEAV